MSAKTDFHNAVENATDDSLDIQLKYATYLKALKYADDNDSVGKENIFINRYLRADYTDETAFLVKVKTFSGHVKLYVSGSSLDDQRMAHKNIMSSFADTTLFYQIKRTIPTMVFNFTNGTNNDTENFETMRDCKKIALDGENVTIGALEEVIVP
jgi:hypothetical protein